MKVKTRLLSILSPLPFLVQAQVSDTSANPIIVKRSLRLLTGLSFGKHSFADIGISKNSVSRVGYHPFSSAYFASTELKLGGKFILGSKIGAWMAGGVGGMAMGANLIYYTDFNKGNLVFRPEIGFGFEAFKLVYGYNAIIGKRTLEEINWNQGSVIYCFKMRQLKDKIKNSQHLRSSE